MFHYFVDLKCKGIPGKQITRFGFLLFSKDHQAGLTTRKTGSNPSMIQKEKTDF